MGKSEEDSGGRKLVYVSLGLTFVIGLVLGGTIFFLDFKSSRETAALQSKVSLLTNEIIVLRHNLAHLNNTVIGLNTKESSRVAQPTEEEYEYAEEYDDPNSDSYEDEEDDENYNDNTPAPPSNSSPSSLMSKSSTNDGRSKRESYLDSDNILTKETISNINHKSGLEVDQNTSKLNRDDVKEDNTHKTTYIMQKHFPGFRKQSPVKHKLNIRRTQHGEISSQGNRLLRLLSSSKKQIEQKDFDTELSSGVNTVNRYKRGGRQEDVELFTRSEFSNNAGNTGNPVIAAHFGADESKCKNRRHQHCESNDIRYHPQNHIKDWQSANWMNLLGASSSLEINDGVLTAQHSGLYFIYAQVFYADTHDVCGFRIYQNNDPILQCTETTIHQNNTRLHKRNSCFTGSLIHLQKGDRLMIKETEENRYTIFERTKTFFGLFKVGNL